MLCSRFFFSTSLNEQSTCKVNKSRFQEKRVCSTSEDKSTTNKFSTKALCIFFLDNSVSRRKSQKSLRSKKRTESQQKSNLWNCVQKSQDNYAKNTRYTWYKCKTNTPLHGSHVWASLDKLPTGPNSHEDWFLDFPCRVLEYLEVRLLLPTDWPIDSDEPLHCRVPGTMSSSMSSMSSDMMKCCGVALPPMKAGSKLRDRASDGRPGLLTMVKPVRISICCQRCSLSRRAAVTSPRACLGDKRSACMCVRAVRLSV